MTDWRPHVAIYQPHQKTVYKISRTKIELFMQCPRCFWLEVRLGIKRPKGPQFKINQAIDELFKKEFDEYRSKKTAHPLMVEYGIAALPWQHRQLNQWRENFSGVSTLHKPTNLHIFGAIDDLWINEAGEAIVVDYKATAKEGDVNIEADWQISYKRQIEIYQWLLRQNGLQVSNIGYFVYANARLDASGFFDQISFKTKVIAYEGNDSWVESVLVQLKNCMDGDIPAVGRSAMGGVCDFCDYAKKRTALTLQSLQPKTKKVSHKTV